MSGEYDAEYRRASADPRGFWGEAASAVEAGIRVLGETKCTYGTGAFLLATVGSRGVRSTAGLTTSVAWQTTADGAAYCIDGQVYTVASAVRWLVELGVLWALTN